jgi:hypothetical protein
MAVRLSTIGRRRSPWFAVLAGIALAAPMVVRAAPLPLSLVRVHPVDDPGTTLMAGREAAHAAGDPDRWKIKADVWLQNNGPDDLEVESVTTSYPGSGVAPASDPPTTVQVLVAGQEGRVRVFDGITRALPVPLPPTIHVEIGFVGTTETFEFDRALAFYENDTPLGSRLFPMAAADLAAGEAWSYGTRHIDDAGAGAPSTVRDRYAYDLDVVRWDGDSWTGVGVDDNGDPLPGTSNSDFLAFGLPIYAVDDGQVIVCTRGVAENTPGVLGASGGNELWIQHGDEVVRYSHFKNGSLSASLCPFNDGDSHDVEGSGITVTAGQQIGQIGNTGQSSGPHMHLSIHRRADRTDPLETSFELADSRPLGFHNIRIASDPTSVDNLGGSPTFRRSDGPILPSHTLILPNPCGLDIPGRGGIEVARHGISEDCYQDVANLVVGAGYRPTFVDGYNVGSSVFFNAVFRPTTVAWVARHGLTSAEYQDLFEDLTDDGYRLHHIDAYRSGNELRYAPIFEKRSGPGWVAYHGLTTAQHLAGLDALRNDGFVPVRVAAVDPGDGGGTRWAALFEQVPVSSWDIVDVSTADYQNAFDDQVDAGRLPITIHGYGTGGGARLTAVFVDPIGGDWSAVHGFDSDAYDAAHDAAFAAGRLLRAVAGYDEGGHRYAAIWRSLLQTTVTGGPPAFTNATTAALTFTSDDPWARFECRLDGGPFAPCSSPKSYSSVAEGSHLFRVRAIDRDSLADPTPATRSWIVDTTPPVVDITRPVPGFTYAHDVPSPRDDSLIKVVGFVVVKAVATDALSGIASLTFTVDGNPIPPASVTSDPATHTWSFTFTPTANGQVTYAIAVTATDVAGNVASDSISVLGVKTGKP